MKRLLVVPALLLLAACQGVSAEQLEDAPPATYRVEYYEISKG